MKKTLSIILSLAMLMTLFTAMPVSAELSTTTIEGKTFYQIGTAADYLEFVTMANADLTINGILTADIDLSGETVTSIGIAPNSGQSTATSYQGIFDGNNHVIRNMSISRTFSAIANAAIAMFNMTDGATIKNLGIENATITNTGAKDGVFLSALVGRSYGTTIENCYVKNSNIVSNNKNNYIQAAGPIAAFINSTTVVRNCYSTGNSIGFTESGGKASGGVAIACFVGWLGAGTGASNIVNSYAKGNTLLNRPSGQKSAGFARVDSSGNTDTQFEHSYTDKKTGFDASTTMGYYASDADEWSDGTVLAGLNNGGSAWKADTYGINGNAPRLSWEADPYAITIGTVTGGSVSASAGYSESGNTITLTLTPNTGYSIDWVKVNGNLIDAPYTSFTMPAENVTVTAQFSTLATTVIEGNTFYQIGNAGDYVRFVSLTNSNLSANAILTADIDLNGVSVSPIGKYNTGGVESSSVYTGIFDGNGHVIRNLTISKAITSNTDMAVGMFATIGTGSIIRNLGLENAEIENTAAINAVRIAAIVGVAYGTAKIQNCYVKNSTIQSMYEDYCIQGGGSIAGYISANTVISNCYAVGNSLGFSSPGGTLSNSGIAVGSFVGYTGADATDSSIQNSYAANNTFKNLPTSQNRAGFARYNYSGDVYLAWTNCYTDKLTGRDSGSGMTKYAKGASEWKTLATALNNGGSDWKDDIYDVNGGYPRLSWEAEPTLYTISVTTPSHGTVTASSPMMREGGTVTLTVTPDSTYAVDWVKVNGNLIDAPYTSFTMPAANVTITAQFSSLWSGSGTEVSPYLISTEADLEGIRKAVNNYEHLDGLYFALTNDINMSGTTFSPIGSISSNAEAGESGKYFAGTFDGNEHIIRNLTIDVSSRYASLFGVLRGATVKNLGIEDSTFRQKGNYFAAPLATDVYNSTISGCYTKGCTVNVQSSAGNNPQAAGGLIARVYGTTSIDYCYTKNIVLRTETSGVYYTASAGGLAGYVAANATINNCYTAGIRFVTISTAGNVANFARFYGTPAENVSNCYTEMDMPRDNEVDLPSVTIYASNATQWATMATTLGIAYFKNDTYSLNGGKPRLLWEADAQIETEFTYDFENPFSQYANDFVVNESGGNVLTSTYLEHNCLEIKAKNNGYYHTVTRHFDAVTDGRLHIATDILFKSVKAENGFISIGKDESELLKVGVVKGNLVYLAKDGNYKTIKENIARNKWYTLSINADFDKGIWKLTFDGEDIPATFDLADSECTNVCFYTKYSPGFCIDNLRIEKMSDNAPEIYGSTQISYVPGSAQSYIYSADESVEWSVLPNVSGLTSSTLGNGNLQITLANDMDYSGVVVVNATNLSGDSSQMSVLITAADVADVVVKGSNRVAYGKGTFTYTATVYDKFGNTLSPSSVIWNITGSDKVSISNGIVTVNSAFTEDTPIEITATAMGMTGTKRIVGQDADIYTSDLTRWNKLISAVDTAIERGRDIYGNTPLLASGYDVTTGKPTEFLTKNGRFAPANLAMDSVFYRMLDRLSELSGQEKYRDKVDEVYKWYLENGVNEATMLGYWGGHTFIDLKTGNIYMANGNTYTHELKYTCLYFEPFYRLNKNKAQTMFKSIWGGHVGSVSNWANLKVNRHANFDAASVNGVVSSTAAMDNLDAFTAENENWQSYNNGIPFRAVGEDLAILGIQEYSKTDNDVALIWAKRMLNMYYNCRNADTGIVPTIFANARNAEGKQSLTGTYGSEWWKMTSSNGSEWTTPVFGDRFFNQFAEDLVAQGFYDSSALNDDDTRLLDGNYFSDSDNIEQVTINDLSIAQTIGLNTDTGKEIRDIAIKNIAGYIKYAWNEGTLNFNKIMADGTSLTGFAPTKNGYYGNYYTNGSSGFKTFIPDSDITDRGLFEAVAKAYMYCANETSLSEEADILESYLQYHLESYGITTGGVVNGTTSEKTPEMLNALICLYRMTDNAAYLNLARIVADNMVSYYCQKGVFSSKVDSGGTRYKNIELGGRSTKYYNALLNLESTICEKEATPVLWKFASYFEDYFKNESTGTLTRTWDSTVYALTY